jgi:hypothetical protein
MPNAFARYLAETGRSKYSVAKAAGCHWKTVHRLARGQHTPGEKLARAISVATDGAVSIEALLSIGPTVATKRDDASPGHAESAA